MNLRLAIVEFLFFVFLTVAATAAPEKADPLSAWQDTATKARIVAFVTDATTQGGRNFIAPEDRIAVFDNDGTLWAEQPLYFQFVFALDRVKELAPQHPEWTTQQPFKAVLEDDRKALAATGEKELFQLIAATHTGMTTDAYAGVATKWLASARHPRCGCPYTDLAYVPMLELLGYLRANGFKTYIVTGGTVEFVRAFAPTVYGIPPEQIIGTTFATQLAAGADGKPAIEQVPKIEFIDDGPGKPVAIDRIIGRRPVVAFGNSDGDWQMLQWTAAGSGPRFVGLVHHTDGAREWAYDRASAIGKLDKALDDAKAKGWLVVDMKRDWRAVFPSTVKLAPGN